MIPVIYGVICPECNGTKQKKVDKLFYSGVDCQVVEECDACDEWGIARAPVDNREGVAWERE